MIVPFEKYMKAEKYTSNEGANINFTNWEELRSDPLPEIGQYVEKICELAMNEKFVVGPNVASWLNIRGFHVHKVCARNTYLDVVVVEPVLDTPSGGYIAVDMSMKSHTIPWSPGGRARGRVIQCKIWKILENTLTPEDELLLIMAMI